MAEFELLLNNQMADNEAHQLPHTIALVNKKNKNSSSISRIASLDVFRGLSVSLMMLVDYGGSIFPIIAHSPWNAVHLADFVMPFFLFAVGVSLALVYKKVPNRGEATRKAIIRALKLFLLGVFLQGGYLHGINSLTYGVDIERIRWFGILQVVSIMHNFRSFTTVIGVSGLRIAIGYLVAALCEIWLPRQKWSNTSSRNYIWHWCAGFLLCITYMGLLYGLYVPDWQFKVLRASSTSQNDGTIYTVTCSARGDFGPACNAAGMIDRYILGIRHLYQKPAYRNLKECSVSKNGQVPESSPSWCHAPFDPEGILSSLTASVACIIGLQYGHVLAQIQDHKARLSIWYVNSCSLMVLGLFLAFIGVPVNKSLYTISYLLITSATAGITFCLLYILVDLYGWRKLTFPLEWVGKHSLSIFIIIASNLAVIVIQGFYWTSPENNIIHWIVSHVVQK